MVWSSAEHEIRTEKCLDVCQHNIKFVLTFTKNDLTLVETYAYIALNNFDSDTCQIKVGIVHVNTKVVEKCQMSNCHFMLCSVVHNSVN